MPNIKSSKKRVKVNENKRLRNRIFTSQMRTDVKKANSAVEANDPEKVQVVRIAVKKIDQAVAKGILHKNTAARKKSALDKKLNAGA